MIWLPIETAPKDGTEFVMVDANVNTATVGHWMADVEWRNAGRLEGEGIAEPSWFPLSGPTHWMPLPPLPTR
jgi:hypothetical protein